MIASNRPISSRAFRANIPTTKSQTGNIWGSAGFESTEELVTLSNDVNQNFILLNLKKKLYNINYITFE